MDMLNKNYIKLSELQKEENNLRIKMGSKFIEDRKLTDLSVEEEITESVSEEESSLSSKNPVHKIKSAYFKFFLFASNPLNKSLSRLGPRW